MGTFDASRPLSAPTGWLRLVVKRALPDTPIVLPVIGGPLFGRWLRADFSRRPQYLFGTYETAVVRAINENLRLGQVAYDIGANLGYMAMVMSQIVGPLGRVIAFEPSPRAHRLLRANATGNRGLRFEPVQIALADSVGQELFSDFSYDLVSRLGDHSAEYPDADLVQVPVETLDHLVESGELPAPDFVKLDVEGAEARVIRGMLGVIKVHQPLVLAELHEEQAAHEATRLFLDQGYAVSVLTRDTPRQVLFKPPRDAG